MHGRTKVKPVASSNKSGRADFKFLLYMYLLHLQQTQTTRLDEFGKEPHI